MIPHYGEKHSVISKKLAIRFYTSIIAHVCVGQWNADFMLNHTRL